MDSLFIYDVEINGMNAATFSSFLNYSAKAVLPNYNDVTLEGFDLVLSTMDFFEGRLRLEYFFETHIEKLNQYVVKSVEANSKIIINYSPDGIKIEHLYGNPTIFEELKNYRGRWGIFKIEK